MSASVDIFSLEKHGTSAHLYLDALTGLRGIAAIWVALWHAWKFSGRPTYEWMLWGYSVDLTPLIRTGWAGVDVFFVLSGFVLGLPYCQALLGNRPPIRTGEFFRRRLLRVLPAYYVQLIILLLLWLILAGHLPVPVTDILAHSFMLHNIFPGQGEMINGVYWTLPIEFDFYLALPLMALLLAPKKWPWLVAGSLLLVLVYRYGMFHEFLLDARTPEKVRVLNQLPGRLEQFVSGMLAAYVYSMVRESGVAQSSIYRWRSLLFSMSFFSVIGLSYFIHYIQPMDAQNLPGQTFWAGHWSLFSWHTLFGMALALMILSLALGIRGVNWLLANQGMLYLGVISYSIYLWHLPIVKLLGSMSLPEMVPDAPFLNLVLWALVPVMAVSSLSYFAVERPFLKLRHRSNR
jgi:peptidoglycan/LPS O-acetylase OafA/YrhL